MNPTLIFSVFVKYSRSIPLFYLLSFFKSSSSTVDQPVIRMSLSYVLGHDSPAPAPAPAPACTCITTPLPRELTHFALSTNPSKRVSGYDDTTFSFPLDMSMPSPEPWWKKSRSSASAVTSYSLAPMSRRSSLPLSRSALQRSVRARAHLYPLRTCCSPRLRVDTVPGYCTWSW